MDYDKASLVCKANRAKAEAKLQAEVDSMVDELVRLDMDRQERILARIAAGESKLIIIGTIAEDQP